MGASRLRIRRQQASWDVFLEEKEQPYVLALSGKAHVWSGFYQHRVSGVLEALREGELAAEESWERLSSGDGSKGLRLYD